MQAAPAPSPAVTSLGSQPSAPAPSVGRQYHPSSPSRKDIYYSSPQTSSNQPPAQSPSRRSGRRASGNAASPNPNTTPNSHPQSPSMPSPNGSDVTTPRNLPIPPQTSPPAKSMATMSPSTYDGAQISAPPRTSSNQPGRAAAASGAERGSSPRVAAPAADPQTSSSRSAAGEARERRERARGAPDGYAAKAGGDRGHENSASAAAIAAQSRRRGPQSSPREPRSSSSREAGSQQSPPAPDPPAAPTDPAISREGSAVLDRVVVTDPQVDLIRETERLAEAQPVEVSADRTPVTGLGLVGEDGVEDGGRGAGRSRHDYAATSSRRKETRFGEYILGQTLGEGEFGKVKMGWKKEGGVQVAIKLIRRESLGTNPTRLPKIYREISILRELSHPNIVRLHEMVETERHIGIILEYASGGELFDYILTHRYLKDQAARRLFAQLVSGVGYLHKKGIVHRDLKLENLLLDRNRNIIITDFGFANTFDPNDELGDEIEFNLTNKDFVRKHDLERIRDSGYRRGDLMQTSCGSPCYAAPELVVSDSLYTGRKVDVWSCGVILYAMLAGYLPFDDDPANPEGDNINLLYKYIVSTPLTFPEYVTPHARDLLRRILVAEPRTRADLFEVARHSWLSEYAHVVSFITSSTTTTGDITNTTVTSDEQQEAPLLTRSASVREPSKGHTHVNAVGGLAQKHGNIDPGAQATQPKTQRDAKRRTVQVEYVAPQSQTARGDPISPIPQSPPAQAKKGASPRIRAVYDDRGPAEASTSRTAPGAKGVPQEVADATPSRATPKYQTSPMQNRTRQRPSSSSYAVEQPSRNKRDGNRAVSESAHAFATAIRPRTGGSMASTGSAGMPSRGSYSRPGQPAAPSVATTNAHGKLAQPSGGKQYVISDPMRPADGDLDDAIHEDGQEPAGLPPSSHGRRPVSMTPTGGRATHKRSNTVGGLGERLFGRTGSLFGGRHAANASQPPDAIAREKRYPPTSMPAAVSSSTPRASTDSRRSTSYSNYRKSTGPTDKATRRFSLLGAFSKHQAQPPPSRDQEPPPTSYSTADPVLDMTDHFNEQGREEAAGRAFGRAPSGSPNRAVTDSPSAGLDGQNGRWQTPPAQPAPPVRNARRSQAYRPVPAAVEEPPYHAATTGPGEATLMPASETSLNVREGLAPYPAGFNSSYDGDARAPARWGRTTSVLKKNNRKFLDAYEQEPDGRFAPGTYSSGSSGAARRVMDFFRRRGKAREGEDR
ncbi:MAG: hypothetical protein M1838_001574 [Thelocarpon superellum]|nr:MAG: hypothetical protein M1838_001574 [Thelocarpon superellum]